LVTSFIRKPIDISNPNHPYQVLDLKPGVNDVQNIKPGIYFIKGARSNKVIITR